MLGFQIENGIKDKTKFTTFIILSGVGGNLMSAVIRTQEFGVGASTCLFAMIGALCVQMYLVY